MLRKLLLCSVVILIPESFEQGRALLALLVSIFFLALHAAVKPFRSAVDNWFVSISYLGMVVLYVSVMLERVVL